MKKLFALLMVAGTLSVYSCGGEKKAEEGTVDTTAAVEATPMDTAAAVVDTAAAAVVDTAAAAPAAH